jgi:hypothetical protein
MPMRTKSVELTCGATGERVKAELLVCPSCGDDLFVVYIPAGLNHVHFQCVGCEETFCDGCAPPGGEPAGFPP